MLRKICNKFKSTRDGSQRRTLYFLLSLKESGVEDMVLKEEEIGGAEDEKVVHIEMEANDIGREARDADMEAAEDNP